MRIEGDNERLESSVVCPACNEAITGRIGNRHYYCWSCLIEFQFHGEKNVRLYFVEEDGSLKELE